MGRAREGSLLQHTYCTHSMVRLAFTSGRTDSPRLLCSAVERTAASFCPSRSAFFAAHALTWTLLAWPIAAVYAASRCVDLRSTRRACRMHTLSATLRGRTASPLPLPHLSAFSRIVELVWLWSNLGSSHLSSHTILVLPHLCTVWTTRTRACAGLTTAYLPAPLPTPGTEHRMVVPA